MKTPDALDRIADKVLAFRPKDKQQETSREESGESLAVGLMYIIPLFKFDTSPQVVYTTNTMSTGHDAYTVLQALQGKENTNMKRRGFQRGSLIRRGKVWSVRYRKPIVDSAGKFTYQQTTERIGTCDEYTIKQAQSRADEIVAAANSVSAAPASKATLRQFVGLRFNPERVSKMRPSGKAHYEYVLDGLVLSKLGDRELGSIRPSVVQGFLNDLSGKYSLQTVTHARNAISAVFSYARLLDFYTGPLPTEDVICSGREPKVTQALTGAQLKQLLEVAPAEYRLLFHTVAITGLRVGEATGLCWDCVNLSDDPTVIDGSLVPPRSILVLRTFSRGEWGKPKTAHSRRVVPLPSIIVEQLKVIKPESTEGLNPVFKSSTGTPLDYHNIASRHLKPAGAKIGCPWLHWHALRHTASSILDVDAAVRQKVLGHATAAMTVHYTHPELEGVRASMEAAVN